MMQGFLSVLSYVKLKADAGSFCALVQHQRHLDFIVPEQCGDDDPVFGICIWTAFEAQLNSKLMWLYKYICNVFLIII